MPKFQIKLYGSAIEARGPAAGHRKTIPLTEKALAGLTIIKRKNQKKYTYEAKSKMADRKSVV